MAKQQWNEQLVYRMLAKAYPSPAYVMMPQVRNGTGYARKRTRTADALAASVWPSRGLYLTGFEIKVSRGDWRKELADPQKAADMQQYCRYWYVVAPDGVVDVGEVPDNWGLIVVNSTSVKNAKAAPALEHKQPDMLLLCSVLRASTETMVPRSEVESMVEDKLDTHVKSMNQSSVRRIQELERQIREFEEASGVTLGSAWEAGNIGAAVKFVRESGVMGARSIVERLRNSILNTAHALDRALKGMPENTEDTGS